MTGIGSAEAAVRAFTFVANLLESAANVSDVQEELKHGEFVERLVAFGFKLAGMELDLPTSTTDDAFAGFLRSLWDAPLTQQGGLLTQEAATIKAADGLSELFGGVDTVAEGLQRIQFAENLIEAAKLAPSLVEQADDVEFLDALLGLGGAYAALEPVRNLATGAGEAETEFYLETLYRAENEAEIQNGIVALQSFFESSDNFIDLTQYQQKLLFALKSASPFQEALSDLSFIEKILALGKDYVIFKSNSTEPDDPSDFLGNLWNTDSRIEIKKLAASLESFNGGRFDDLKISLYDFIANGSASIDDFIDKTKSASSFDYGDRIIRPHNVTVISKEVTLLLTDTNINDGDGVSIKINGRDLGISIPLSTERVTKVPITLSPGTNTISVRALSTGTVGPATILFGFLGPELDKQVHYRNRGYFVRVDLAAQQTQELTIGLPQVPISARKYPDVGLHMIEAWQENHPRVLTIDRFGRLGGFASKESRRNASISRYVNNTNNSLSNPQLEDYDEYAPAMFLENYGRASVKIINKSQNRGAGKKTDLLLASYRDGEQIEMITNYLSLYPPG
jgi:hypothetical protein